LRQDVKKRPGVMQAIVGVHSNNAFAMRWLQELQRCKPAGTHIDIVLND
jgi:hypothetical protein